MKASNEILPYSSPEATVVELRFESLLCASDLTYGGNEEPGINPDWGDDYDF